MSSSVQAFKRSSVQAFKRSSVQAFKRSSVQAFKRSSVPSKLAGFSVSGTASAFFPVFFAGVAGGCRPAAAVIAVVPGAGGRSVVIQLEDRL
jgi:hypothetical protein